MQSRDELVGAIREFVRVDNEIRVLGRELAARRKLKTEISSRLMSTMREHSIDCFEVQGGKIVYNRRSVKRPLTQKLLNELIRAYFREDEGAATEFSAYLRDNRQETVKESITRKDGGGGGADGATNVVSAAAANTDGAAAVTNSEILRSDHRE